MTTWIDDAIFYHIYPLGFFGCEQYAQKEVNHRLPKLKEWIPHLQDLHINALYLGPIFSSYEHGYDTSDYRIIDPRLGTNDDFKDVCEALKQANIRIVLDGVFNHVGRDFWAFRDCLEKQDQSPYADWFHIRFNEPSPWGDPFTYDTWEGHPNLVKLNLKNEAVVQYLLDSIALWMEEFQIDGLRLDAADCIDPQFFKRLKNFCKEKNPEFWLMAEIIHGDYNRWANEEMLDSVTNYECYKGLYSSHNEKNYFEIGYSFNRQFGNGGIYKNLRLYNFVDNHDVNRLASTLRHEEDLKNVYTMLYTMPGIPSIYYGSEFGIKGEKHNNSDADIRPYLADEKPDDTELTKYLKTLGAIYMSQNVLRQGSYQQMLLKNEQFVFTREDDLQILYAAFNVNDKAQEVSFPCKCECVIDLLTDECFSIKDGMLNMMIDAHSSRLLVPTDKRVDIVFDKQQKPHKGKTIHQKEEPLETIQVTDTEIKMGRYRHFKGKEYTVLYIAKHSETLEDYVVYRQLYGNESVWIRPLSMFQEMVEHHGKQQPRFQYIGK